MPGMMEARGPMPSLGEVYVDGRCTCCRHHIYVITGLDDREGCVAIFYACECHAGEITSLSYDQVRNYHSRLF